MNSLEQKALEIVIDPLIKINESQMAYSIVDLLYHHKNGIERDLIKKIVKPENIVEFFETIRELHDLGMTERQGAKVVLTDLGSEAYYSDKVVKNYFRVNIDAESTQADYTQTLHEIKNNLKNSIFERYNANRKTLLEQIVTTHKLEDLDRHLTIY